MTEWENYGVIEAATSQDLANGVMNAVQMHDAQPIGGICIFYDPALKTRVYAQAIGKPKSRIVAPR